MKRRELLALLGSGASASVLSLLSPTERLELGKRVHRRLRGTAAAESPRALDSTQHQLVSTIADLILPRTDTPGATDVGVPQFIDLLLAEWYTAEERGDFLAGLSDLEERCRRRYGAPFAELSEERRVELLRALDGKPGEKRTAEQSFGRLKSLTLYGYFTSEPVMKEVLKSPVIPGRYSGCFPLGQS